MRLRTPSLLLLSALALAGAAYAQKTPAKPGASAFDKTALEAYVRHLYVMDSKITLAIAEPEASEVPGFSKVVVHASAGTQSQNFEFLVSQDGKKMLTANVYDIDQNPFKKALDKLKTDGAPSLGTPGASVVLVVFSDFECPHCRVEAQMLREKLLAAYPTQVRLYFRDFPLESIHDWAKPAAVAGRCVYNQLPLSFWDYHDFVFERQDSINAGNFRAKVMDWVSSQKDLDSLKFGQCLTNQATAGDVESSIAQARALGLNGTPSVFVNGRLLSNPEWELLSTIIDNEIGYQKTAKNAGEDCGCDTTLPIPGAPSKGALPFSNGNSKK